MQQVISVPLDGGGEILVEVAADGREVPYGVNPGQAVAQAARTLQEGLGLIRQVARAFRDELAGVTDRPDALAVKFAVQFNAEGIAVVARMGVAANFEVTMEWHADQPSPAAPALSA